MKQKILSKIILLLITNMLFIGLLSIKVKGISDLSYTFNNNLFYNNTIDSYQTSNPLGMDEPYNLKYQSEYTELYNASYSFTNETGVSINISFINRDDSAINTGSRIISDLDNHNKVIEFYDNNNSGFLDLFADFSAQTFGTIEWWWRSNATTKGNQFILEEGTTRAPRLMIDNGFFQYHDGGSFVNIRSASNNIWYHLKLEFECGGGGYKGLASDTFYIWINDIRFGAYTFVTPTTEVDNIRFNSLTADTGYSFYIDAIGYSWLTNYTIGKNIFPFLNTSTTLMEVNRYEFALNDIHSFNELFTDDYINSGWSDESEGGGITVIDEDIDASYDRVIKNEGTSINSVGGIEKDNIGLSGNFINVSFGFYYTIFDGTTNVFEIRVYSSDNQQITGITMYADLKVKYRDDIGFVDTNIDLILNERIEFNLFINYELNRVFFIYKRDGIVVGNFDYPTILENKEGLKKINWISFNYQNEINKNYIDFIGIYSNGKSQVGKGIDFGIALIDTEKVWSRGNHNLINFIGNGTFHIASTSLYYYYARSTPPIKETTTYYNDIQFVNAYDDSVIHLFNGIVVLTVLGNNFNFSYLKINGVILNESSNSYNLIYEYGNINISESYFYSENNQLKFNIITNDTNLEYIQASFNINDVSTNEYSISFKARIDNNAFGLFRINYTETSNIVQIPNIDKTVRSVLSQDLIITNFVILITDRDINTVLGLTTGYLSDIELLITANLGQSIIITALIFMFIPLIIILIPTLSISSIYGKALIVPLFILFSVICVASGLIPLWLFFVIAISNTLFLLKTKELN